MKMKVREVQEAEESASEGPKNYRLAIFCTPLYISPWDHHGIVGEPQRGSGVNKTESEHFCKFGIL